jgi:hypothetical protein
MVCYVSGMPHLLAAHIVNKLTQEVGKIATFSYSTYLWAFVNQINNTYIVIFTLSGAVVQWVSRWSLLMLISDSAQLFDYQSLSVCQLDACPTYLITEPA